MSIGSQIAPPPISAEKGLQNPYPQNELPETAASRSRAMDPDIDNDLHGMKYPDSNVMIGGSNDGFEYEREDSWPFGDPAF